MTFIKENLKGIGLCLLIAVVIIFIGYFFKSGISKEFPQAKYDQAYELMIQENFAAGEKAFERLSKKSIYPEIWYGLGSCAMETKNYEKAIAAFNKTAELYDNSVMYDDKVGLRNDAMTSIGEVYLLQRDFEKAKEQFEKCLKLKNDREMIYAIAAAYIRNGFTDEAEQYFSEKGIDIWM